MRFLLDQDIYGATTTLTDPTQATPEWLTGVLARSGCLPRGYVIDVSVSVTSSFTSTIGRLSLTYSGDAPSTAPSNLFLKVSNPQSGQRVVGADQWRWEVQFHREIAPMIDDPPVVPCYDAAFDEQTGAAHLLLLDVSETHTQPAYPLPPSRVQAERTMDAFAQVHAFWWDHPDLDQIDELPNAESTRAYVTSIGACYPGFADFLADRLSGARRRVYDRVLAALPRLYERITSGAGLTLIHGDANWQNVLVPRDPDGGRALIIDWQLWNISFGAEALANLIALQWFPDRRAEMERDLLLRYHEGLMRRDVAGHTWDDCWNDYRLAVVTRALFMPMWQWSSGQPPRAWWAHLECTMQAFDDLGCSELLGGPL